MSFSETGIRIGGGVTYFRLASKTNLEELVRRLGAIGLADYVPEPISDKAALRQAIDEVFQPADKAEKLLVRPKPDCAGYAVSVERPKDDVAIGDAWTVLRWVASVSEEGVIDLRPYDPNIVDMLIEKMHEARRSISAGAVSKALTTLVGHVGGVCLRDNGGVYWVRDDRLQDWENVADAFQRSAEKGETKIYLLRVQADSEMIRAVGDSLRAEVEEALAAIEAEVQDVDSLSETKCENRVRKIAEIERKIRDYETAFQAPLNALHTMAQRAGSAVATAQMILSAVQSPLFAGQV